MPSSAKAPVAPKAPAASKTPVSSKPKMTEAEIRQMELNDAKLALEMAKNATAKQKLANVNKVAEAAKAK